MGTKIKINNTITAHKCKYKPRGNNKIIVAIKLKIINKIGDLLIGKIGENCAIKLTNFIVNSAIYIINNNGKSKGIINDNNENGTKINEKNGTKILLAMGEIIGK